MKASLNWIKEFVPVKAKPQEIAERLSMAGMEIESVQTTGKGLDSIVTATILKIQKHPKADRLSLCEVRSGKINLSVVCGAKNMKEGDKVALARPGVTLPNGVTIKEATIRDVKSHGMLCSETELGLASVSAGIMILPPDTPEGIPLTKALPLADTILEVNVTPNRGDCLSMMGLAREVGAVFQLSFRPRENKIKNKKSSSEKISIKITAPKLCTRYSCRVLRGVKIGPSPVAVQRRLESCGIRPINNIVDATNYVMLETGQPLHAFDLSQIKEGKVFIRAARPHEKMKTLDGEDRSLQETDLVIADGQRVLALAGVMGGQDSGVENSTVDLLLESACFNPNAVRKSAKRFVLQTESSYRFERGVDPNGCAKALDRLTDLILELAGGGSAGEMIDLYPKRVLPKKISLRSGQIKRILGIELPSKEIIAPLQRLGIKGRKAGKDRYHFEIPTFRFDLTREIDLIEEVARLYGYNRIPVAYPKISLSELLRPGPNEWDRLDQIRRILVGWGFSEVLHYSFTDPDLLRRFGLAYGPELTLINPISEDLSVMRPALIPQMVETLRSNIFKGNKDLKFFEIRPVYAVNGQGGHPFKEGWHLCLGISGVARPQHFLQKAGNLGNQNSPEAGFLDLKGYFETLMVGQGGGKLEETSSNQPFFHPNRQALLRWRPKGTQGPEIPLGTMGQIHPQFLQAWDIPVPVVTGEINLDLFLTESKFSIQFQEISPFPTVWRDLNLIVDEAVPNGRVMEVIRTQGGSWVRRAELLDLYRGQPLTQGQKALTYRIEYGANDRTLTDEVVNDAREKLLTKLKAEIGATLR